MKHTVYHVFLSCLHVLNYHVLLQTDVLYSVISISILLFVNIQTSSMCLVIVKLHVHYVFIFINDKCSMILRMIKTFFATLNK